MYLEYTDKEKKESMICMVLTFVCIITIPLIFSILMFTDTLSIDGPCWNCSCYDKSLKKLVWDTWIGENLGITKCLCCKHQDIRQIEFHCGHVISEKFGGYTSVENLRPICAQCNLSMGSMNMKTFQAQFFLEKLK